MRTEIQKTEDGRYQLWVEGRKHEVYDTLSLALKARRSVLRYLALRDAEVRP